MMMLAAAGVACSVEYLVALGHCLCMMHNGGGDLVMIDDDGDA